MIPGMTDAELQAIQERCTRIGGQFDAQALLVEVKRLRDKLSELNRRCQAAESAAQTKVEEVARSGRSFGRALANWAATDRARQLEEARKDVVSLSEQLTNAEERADTYKDVAETLRGVCHRIYRLVTKDIEDAPQPEAVSMVNLDAHVSKMVDERDHFKGLGLRPNFALLQRATDAERDRDLSKAMFESLHKEHAECKAGFDRLFQRLEECERTRETYLGRALQAEEAYLRSEQEIGRLKGALEAEQERCNGLVNLELVVKERGQETKRIPLRNLLS